MKRLHRVLLSLLMVLGFATQGIAAENKTYTLVLLRHGESVWNKESRFTGWANVPLTEAGEAGAFKAGELMQKEGLVFDEVYTSYLNRAIKTAWLALEGMDQLWIPLHTDWRLNERNYGDLEGKTRKETIAEVGEEQVKIWRRSFDVPPPPMSPDDPRSPVHDPRYKAVPKDAIPQAESLQDVIKRSLPYWNTVLVPELRSNKTILVVGHSTALRALSQCIDASLDAKALQQLEIPNSTPIVYILDENLKPISRKILQDKDK